MKMGSKEFSEEYKFSIGTDQHLRIHPFLQSDLLYKRNLEEVINEKKAMEIVENLAVKDAAANIVQNIPKEGIKLKLFLDELLNKCYPQLDIVDYPRTLPKIIVDGDQTPIYDNNTKIFYESNGKESFRFSEGQIIGNIDEKLEGKQMVENLTDLLRKRNIPNPEFFVHIFNQNTLNGYILETATSLLLPIYGLNFNTFEKVEFILNKDHKIIGLNLLQIAKLTQPLLDEYSSDFQALTEESKNELINNNKIYCSTEIRFDPNENPPYIIGNCNVSSINTTFSSHGKIGIKLLKLMENNSKSIISKLKQENISSIVGQDFLWKLTEKFFKSEKVENISKELSEKFLVEESKLRKEAIKYGIAQDDIEKLLKTTKGIYEIQREIERRSLIQELLKLGILSKESDILKSDNINHLQKTLKDKNLIKHALKNGIAQDEAEKIVEEKDGYENLLKLINKKEFKRQLNQLEFSKERSKRLIENNEIEDFNSIKELVSQLNELGFSKEESKELIERNEIKTINSILQEGATKYQDIVKEKEKNSILNDIIDIFKSIIVIIIPSIKSDSIKEEMYDKIKELLKESKNELSPSLNVENDIPYRSPEEMNRQHNHDSRGQRYKGI